MTDAQLASFTTSLRAFLFCVFLCAPALSLDRDRHIGQFYYTFWSEKNGAPSQISALAQTEDGYLWIGSPRGLFRFDGVKFEEYKLQPGVELPSHSIYFLMATPDGGLWIAFEPTGLGFLKDGSLTVYTRPGELPDSPIHCLAFDHDGRIWAGTETGLVLRQGTRWIPIGRDWNLPSEMIRYLLVDREGTLWVATVKRVAFLRRGSRVFELGGAVGVGITKFAQASDGRVWFADDDRWEVRPVPIAGHRSDAEFPAVVEEGVRELLFDRDGTLWITRMDSGIIRIRYPEKLGNRTYGPLDPELESFGAKDGYSGGVAYKLLEDREGNIWVGCSNGLIRLRHSEVVPVSLPQLYQNLTLLAGENADLWIGTKNQKPLLHIRGDTLLVEKAGEQVCSVFRASNGDIWWGSRTGIWRQRGTEFKYFPLPKSAVPDWMYEITPSRADGGLWVKLGDVGFVHFQQGVWNPRDWPDGVPSVGGTFRYGPSASYVDGSGQIWLGYTSGHVIVLDRARVTVYSQNDGLDVGRIKVIRGLGQHIWVGGELGLMFFSKRRFHRVNIADGEPIGAVSGIIETPNGGLWLNEMREIVHIPPEETRHFMADPNYCVNYRRFNYLDGLPGSPQMIFTNSTAVEASDGRLWFATDNGLARIDPAHLVRNLVPPPVSILSIGSERGRRPISNTVKFAAGTHTVEIDYTALSLSIPERVKFRYKLEDVDADWQNVGTRRQAYYSNLGPGSYRFRVVACNNDGVWNEAGATLDFSIAPAYYQTTWFRLTCVTAFLVLLWALFRLRLRSIRQRSEQLVLINARLEAQIGERKRAEEALNNTQAQLAHVTRVMAMGEMAASIAHEVNQPLSGVMVNATGCLRWLARDPPNLVEAREAVQRIVRDGKRAGDVIARIRALVTKRTTEKERLDLNETIQEAVAVVQGLVRRNRVTLRMELREDVPPVLGDRVQLQQVVLNLIMNAIEAMSKAGGDVRELVVTTQSGPDDVVEVSVRDSGVGVDAQSIPKIFDAFYTTKHGGMGMGLSISLTIVNNHGGRLWVTANDGPGVTFHFTVQKYY